MGAVTGHIQKFEINSLSDMYLFSNKKNATLEWRITGRRALFENVLFTTLSRLITDS